MTRISKRRMVLDLNTANPGSASYNLPDEDEFGLPGMPELHISGADFEALGSPEQITVTIEPGDLLNDEGEAWPLKPGDVVTDIEGAETEWLLAAPEGTVVCDYEGLTWVQGTGLWLEYGSSAKFVDLRHMPAQQLARRGPVTVVDAPAEAAR